MHTQSKAASTEVNVEEIWATYAVRGRCKVSYHARKWAFFVVDENVIECPMIARHGDVNRASICDRQAPLDEKLEADLVGPDDRRGGIESQPSCRDRLVPLCKVY